MSLADNSVKIYTEKFKSLGVDYQKLIMELSQTEVGRNALYKESLRLEQIKSWEEIFSKLNIDIKNVMDIGGGCGAMATAAERAFSSHHVLVVDPGWPSYEKEFVKYFKEDNPAIEIDPKAWCEHTPKVSFWDLIIKTYNPWVSWSEIFKQVKSKYVISNSDHVDFLEDSGYEKCKELRTYINNGKISGDISLYKTTNL